MIKSRANPVTRDARVSKETVEAALSKDTALSVCLILAGFADIILRH
jgi:hypothetical protein